MSGGGITRSNPNLCICCWRATSSLMSVCLSRRFGGSGFADTMKVDFDT